MSIQTKPLKQTYEEIREAIINKLNQSEALSDVQDVIFGEQRRVGSLRTPAIWIVPNSYTPQLRGGHTAQHDIPFDVVALVKHNQPQQGLKDAQDLSLRIYDEVAKDRTLNGLVYDVQPTRVDPAYDVGQSTQVYWSAVQFTFKLQRRE